MALALARALTLVAAFMAAVGQGVAWHSCVRTERKFLLGKAVMVDCFCALLALAIVSALATISLCLVHRGLKPVQG